MKITKLAKRTTPLCYLPDGKILCYHRGSVSVMCDSKVEKEITIPTSILERMLGWNRIAYRLLRFGVRSAIALDNHYVILSLRNRLYEFNTMNGKLSQGWICDEGVRPLVMNNVIGIEGFEDGIYFGGYLGNQGKNPVSIYHRKGIDDWEVVYTFSQGAINHVHNIVPDSYRQCLWVFTGDFGDAAAIWKISNGFKNIERIACGHQQWRGCVVFVMPEGLLYATDTPKADNYLLLLNTLDYSLKKVMPFPGSCINGCKWKDNYVFSTAVESETSDAGNIKDWFIRKRGKGIKDEYVHLFMGNLKDGFNEIYKEKKDLLPFTLFQFGVFKLPIGVNNSNSLFFQPVATCKHDQSLLSLNY